MEKLKHNKKWIYCRLLGVPDLKYTIKIEQCICTMKHVGTVPSQLLFLSMFYLRGDSSNSSSREGTDGGVCRKTK